MTESIRIHSFVDQDRSGKVRWTACELGLDIEEARLKPGDHMAPEYLAMNPFAQVPTVETGEGTLIESTAICIILAQRHPNGGLIPSEQQASESFWQQVALATTTLEMPMVYYYLGQAGILDSRWKELFHDGLAMRMGAYASSLPSAGYLCGDFSLADICAGYVLRLGVQAGLVDYDGIAGQYLDRIRTRPAARASRMFDVLDEMA